MLQVWRSIGRMKLQVECYSGHKGDESPVRFRLDDRKYTVEEILDQWYGPDHVYFKCSVDDGNLCILRRSVPDGPWELVSFRKST